MTDIEAQLQWWIKEADKLARQSAMLRDALSAMLYDVEPGGRPTVHAVLRARDALAAVESK